MTIDTDNLYLLDQFVKTEPGEPFRLFPFGTISKGGKKRLINADFARRVRLPHFKPPIKLGSHRDEVPAGGHIVALEVREDGLYAIPEYNEQGQKALANGAYRYHSPEIIWEGGLENPTTGDLITGPLIVGTALLHTPHLGEAAALYHITQGEVNMEHQGEMVSLSALQQIADFLGFRKQPETTPDPTPAEPPQVDEYAAKFEAAQAEVEKLTAEMQRMQAEQQRGERVAHFAAELHDAATLGEDAELHGLLADMEQEVAAEIVRRFKAVAEQAKVSNLTTDVGSSGTDDEGDPVAAYNAAIVEKTKAGMDFGAAAVAVAQERPDLYRAYAGGN